jgi:hypothetical protein
MAAVALTTDWLFLIGAVATAAAAAVAPTSTVRTAAARHLAGTAAEMPQLLQQHIQLALSAPTLLLAAAATTAAEPTATDKMIWTA